MALIRRLLGAEQTWPVEAGGHLLPQPDHRAICDQVQPGLATWLASHLCEPAPNVNTDDTEGAMKSNPRAKGRWATRNYGTRVQYMDPTTIEEMCSGDGNTPPPVHHQVSTGDGSHEDRLLRHAALSLLLLGVLVEVGRRYERQNRNIGLDFWLAVQNKVHGQSGGKLALQTGIPRKSILRRVKQTWGHVRHLATQGDHSEGLLSLISSMLGSACSEVEERCDELERLFDDLSASRDALLDQCRSPERVAVKPITQFSDELVGWCSNGGAARLSAAARGYSQEPASVLSHVLVSVEEDRRPMVINLLSVHVRKELSDAS